MTAIAGARENELPPSQKLDLSVKLQADVVESFLAALTLDKGLSETEKFLEEYLFPKLLVCIIIYSSVSCGACGLNAPIMCTPADLLVTLTCM